MTPEEMKPAVDAAIKAMQELNRQAEAMNQELMGKRFSEPVDVKKMARIANEAAEASNAERGRA
jgi:hypothetical protein